ncbi:MAG: hypothetical protein IPI81_14695 [Flavobacteriales bacterium]|nr:hypothetical protein [Flavobacteriales bacterium]
MGLQVLEREKAVFKETGAKPDGRTRLHPRATIETEAQDIIEPLKKLMKPDQHDRCQRWSSERKCSISAGKSARAMVHETRNLPVDPTTYQTARDFNLDPSTCALNGEDYELLFTVALADHDKTGANPQLRHAHV